MKSGKDFSLGKHWVEAESIDLSKFTHFGTYKGFMAMEPTGDYFCGRCGGSGAVRIGIIEKLWKGFWQRVPLKHCRDYKPCKCMYYVKMEFFNG